MALSTNAHIWKPLLVIFLVLTGIFALLFYFEPILIVVVLGIVTILMCERIYADYRRNLVRFRIPGFFRRLYAIMLILSWMFALIFLLVTSLQDLSDAFLRIGSSQEEITTSLLSLRTALPHIVAGSLLTEDILLRAQAYIFSLFSGVLSQITFIVVEGFLIIPLMVYTYFTRKQEIWEFMLDAVPTRFRNEFERAALDIGHQLQDYLSARTTQSIILGSMYCLGFYIIGVKGWLVLGMLAGFLNVVPYLGPILALVAPFTVSLLLHDTFAAVYSIVVIMIAQTTDHFYLNTFMVASKVKIDTLLSIILILIGAQLLGILGMIFAIPVYIIYKTVLSESYRALVDIYDSPVSH